jgi:tripartite-type tricarboxylate transporter receptor subunit TctC
MTRKRPFFNMMQHRDTVRGVAADLPTVDEFVPGYEASGWIGLAVTTLMRSDALPNIPPVSDFVPGYEASEWYGIGAPKNTPAEIIDKLNNEINAWLIDPKSKTRLGDLGATPFSGSRASFAQFLADETAKWRKVIRAANIKAE